MQQRDEMIIGLFEEIQKTIDHSQISKDAFVLRDGKYIDIELTVRSLSFALKVNLAALVTTNKLINPKTTPVIITENINWVSPTILEPERRLFADTVQLWLAAKSSNQLDKLTWFYDNNFYNGKNLSDWKIALRDDQAKLQGKASSVSDLSFVRWQDKDDIMVLTYNENSSFRKTSVTKRIYWIRVASQWKIFYEGVIG